MSFSNTGLSVEEVAKKTAKASAVTIPEVRVSKAKVLKRSVKKIPPVDGISTLLNNLSSLQKSHLADRETYFKQNLPFYTCINAVENIWQKEMPDGSIYDVQLTFDWEKDKLIEKLIKRSR